MVVSLVHFQNSFELKKLFLDICKRFVYFLIEFIALLLKLVKNFCQFFKNFWNFLKFIHQLNDQVIYLIPNTLRWTEKLFRKIKIIVKVLFKIIVRFKSIFLLLFSFYNLFKKPHSEIITYVLVFPCLGISCL